MKKLPPSRPPAPLWLYPAGLVAGGGVIGALVVAWSVLPIVLLTFGVAWLHGAYLASTRKHIAEFFERLPIRNNK